MLTYETNCSGTVEPESTFIYISYGSALYSAAMLLKEINSNKSQIVHKE